MKKYFSLTIVISLICWLVITIFFTFKTTPFNSNSIASEIWGHYGDVIGGVIGTVSGFLGVFLLYETLKAQRLELEEQRTAISEQRLALQDQRNAFLLQQIESRFFELIRLHKDNLNDMASKSKSGRELFVGWRDEMNYLMKQIKARYPQNAHGDSNKSVPDWNREVAEISYRILFYGVNNSNDGETEKFISETTTVRGNGAEVLKYFRDLVKAHEKTKDTNRAMKPEYKQYLPFDGQQRNLGHYFRHLYQILRYINNQPANLLSYESKRNYIRILRAQLSTHEQALMFFNSLSYPGTDWELGCDDSDQNNRLITKYDFIRNMPFAFLPEINPEHYYPYVHFEYQKKPHSGKEIIAKQYW
jgi:hypothetical protein